MATSSTVTQRALQGFFTGFLFCLVGSMLARYGMVQNSVLQEWQTLVILSVVGGIVCAMGRALADGVAGAVLGALAGVFLGGAVGAFLPAWNLPYTVEEVIVDAGKPFELSGPGFDGEPIDIVRYKGKLVLVDFWATWCGPCVKEMPTIKHLYQKYHEQGFEVIGVSLDRKREDLQKYLEREKLPWKQIFFDGSVNPLVEKHNVEFIPATFLVDREGNLIAKNLRGIDLVNVIEDSLKEDSEIDKKKGVRRFTRIIPMTNYLSMFLGSMLFALLGALAQRYATSTEAKTP